MGHTWLHHHAAGGEETVPPPPTPRATKRAVACLGFVLSRSMQLPFDTLYFGGAAWGCTFFIGVVRGIEERFGANWSDRVMITGDSAGALIGVAAALGKSADHLEKLYTKLAASAQQHGAVGLMSEWHRRALAGILDDDPEAYKRLNGKFAVGTTSFFGQHLWHTQWSSNDDLLQCLHGSFHIPFYCTTTARVKGTFALDGAYSCAGTDMYGAPESTLWVSVGDKEADIACQPPMSTLECTFPLVGAQYQQRHDLGYDTCCKWIDSGGIVAPIKDKSKEPVVLIVFWFLRLWELILGTHYDYRQYRPGVKSSFHENCWVSWDRKLIACLAVLTWAWRRTKSGSK